MPIIEGGRGGGEDVGVRRGGILTFGGIGKVIPADTDEVLMLVTNFMTLNELNIKNKLQQNDNNRNHSSKLI